VRRYPFGSAGLLDLKCNPRNSQREKPLIEVHSNVPFTLEMIWEGGTEILDIVNGQWPDLANPMRGEST